MRFADDNFTQSFIATIGIDFKIRTIELDGQRIKLQIWDTAGQERFKTITTAYYRGAMGILLVYDVTNEASFKSIANWMRAIEQHASESVNKLLIGNKADSSGPLVGERMVSTEMGEQLAAQHSMKFFETSAKVSKRDPPTHIHIWTMALGKGGPVEGRAPLSSNVPRERCLPSSDPPSSASSARPPSSAPPPPPSLLPLLLTLCLPGSFVTPSPTPTPPLPSLRMTSMLRPPSTRSRGMSSSGSMPPCRQQGRCRPKPFGSDLMAAVGAPRRRESLVAVEARAQGFVWRFVQMDLHGSQTA